MTRFLQSSHALRAPSIAVGLDERRRQSQFVAATIARWSAGEAPDAAAAVASEGERADKSTVLELAQYEYRLRRDEGEPLDPESFARRFPSYAASLAMILMAQEAVGPLTDWTVPVEWPAHGDDCAGLEIVEELGRGAVARVYLAKDRACGDRLVALKLAPDGAREARTLGRLSHPNVVAVLDAKDCPERGLSGLATLYHGRATLCDVLDLAFRGGECPRRGREILAAIAARRASLDPELPQAAPARVLLRGSYAASVLDLGRQLCSALAAAHARGILHLDLKPSNVLLTPSGAPMLLDFNLAADEQNPQLYAGGTLPYMAPEHLRRDLLREPAEVDARADVFSLGVLLYQLLIGRLPFDVTEGVSPVERARGLLACQRAPLDCAGAVEGSIERLLVRCLAVDREDRFSTAEQLGAALSRELSARGAARRWSQTHRRLSRGLAAGLLVALFAAGAWSATRDPYHERQIKLGRASFAAQDYSRAAQHYNNALAINRDDWETMLRLGLAHQRQGEYRQALNNYEDAAKLSNDPRIAACRGYCLYHERVIPAAITCFQEAIAGGFDTAEVRNNLGLLYSRRMKFADALLELTESLKRNPNLLAAYHNRAVVEFHLAQQSKDDVRRAHARAGMESLKRAISQHSTSGEQCDLMARLMSYSIDQTRPSLATASEVLEWLAMAIENGAEPSTIVKTPAYTWLRANPRFQEICNQSPRNRQSFKAQEFLEPWSAD